MPSALWWVLNGRAMAPPGIGCIIGVSTSRKPRASRNFRIAATSRARSPQIVLAELVRPRVELDLTRVVHQVSEAGFAVVTKGDDASGQAHGTEGVQLRLARVAEPVGERACPVGHREAAPEWIDPRTAQRRELLVPRTDQVVGVVWIHELHRLAPAPRAHKRYARISPSRSPSITPSTLPISSTVRWSLMSW